MQFRAFVSNPLLPSTTANVPVLNVIDTATDTLTFSTIGLLTVIADPGIMAVSQDRSISVVVSAADKSVLLINNTTETAGAATTLPDAPDSVLISPDNIRAYAAVRTAPVTGQPAGAVEVVDLAGGRIAATIPVPGVNFIVANPTGTRILALNEDSNTVTVINTGNLGSGTDPRTTLCCFDHPAWAVFNFDGAKAYVMECGPECGGIAAGVTTIDFSTDPPQAGTPLPVDGATVGFLDKPTLYVAGTPPGTPCSSGTLATRCGTLTVIDLSTQTPAVTATATITDGRHNHLGVGSNGQVFVGAKSCTSVNQSGEIRGCLSIFDTTKGGVVFPPDTGDVTAIQPIPNRNVVYVLDDGELRIYDTTTDKLQDRQIDIIGQAKDVKLIY